MATQKTLAPTNQVITIAAFQGEKPDQKQVADAEGKLADAINALNSQLIPTAITGAGDFNTYTGTSDGKTSLYAGSNVSQMANRPSYFTSQQWPFHLHVRTIGGYIQQILITYSVEANPASIFIRNQTYVSGNKVWLNWEQIALSTKKTGSGTASNQYGSATYVYVIRSNICTVFVDYEPNTNITTSSGALTLTDIPTPPGSVVSATYSETQLGSSFGSAVLDTGKSCRFLGGRNSGIHYSTTFTYVIGD